MNEINLEDCRDTMSRMADNSVDSIVTDPPYELGFMGKDWDNTGIAYDVDMWAECLRVLKPGGYLMAFSATRTYHRMAVAIEDAGFEVRDMIEWVYGSGFPKSLNIGKAVDKLQGNERENLGERAGAVNPKGYKTDGVIQSGGAFKNKFNETKGTSEWEGWGTALKPAHEPICMARKPLSEKTVAENCLKWGTGGINVDESRVGTDETITIHGSKVKSNTFSQVKACKPFQSEGQKLGRFPANLIHDNSEEVRGRFPESKSGAIKAGQPSGTNFSISGELNKRPVQPKDIEASSGNASRFFKSIIYQAKASKSERGETNNHPTVKPIALMEYLIKMVTKPNGIVYDPFGGSGTTACACILNGYSYILSEMEADHIEIIKARTEYYKKQHTQATLF